MARHGRRPPPAPAARPVRFFTKHETRLLCFSRNTKHETRNTAFIAVGARGVAPPETSVRPTAPAGKSLFSCSRLFTIVRHCSPKNIVRNQCPRAVHTGNAACKVFTNHETRVTKHGLYAFHESRVTAFLAARSLLSCALRHGIGRLWRGMGGRRPPRRQHGLLGFHQQRITQHVFPLPSGDSKESNSKPGLRVFHESRITRRETRLLCFSTHDFPQFPTISRHFPAPPPHPIKGPRAVRRSRSASRRAPFVGNPTKVHKIPDPTGKCVKHSVRRSSRRPPGCSRCGERK